jgi:hypothetical protein
MKTHHIYLVTLKLIVIISTILAALGVISHKGPIFYIIETLFKVSLAFYLIIYFSNTKLPMDKHDRTLFIGSGVILLLTIDYQEAYEMIISGGKGMEAEKQSDIVHVVDKPCPPCDRSHIVRGTMMEL